MKSTPCTYCGGSGVTSDHVPPKCLLEKPYPPNLATVRSCTSCNQSYSLDEQYFLVTLANIGTHPRLLEKISEGGSVDRALTRAPWLDDRITNALIPEKDRIYFRPEEQRISRVLTKIAAGLFARRYSTRPQLNSFRCLGAFPYNIEESRPYNVLLATFTERFQSKRWIHVQKGIFSYTVVRAPLSSRTLLFVMDFYCNLWGVVAIDQHHTRRFSRSSSRTAGQFSLNL